MIRPTAIDLFSGAGGATQGLRDSGFDVLTAIENDVDAAETFALNHPETDLIVRNIQRVQAPALARAFAARGQSVNLLTACPPCQPFSTLGTGETDDPRNGLVSSVLRFVEQLCPSAVILENVPGLRREPRFVRLVAALSEDYNVRQYLVQASDFGVPQSRRRVIVMGVQKDLGAELPFDLAEALPDRFDATPTTSGDALAIARKIPTTDPLHRGRRLQPMTIARIRAVPRAGSRAALPPELELDCHKRLSTSAATSIYGRINESLPSPTMTTRCTTPSCGRFVHPNEDRGITLREAALLQTFPVGYHFAGTYGSIERQIGNAVPPRLAQALGEIVRDLITPGSSRDE